jgi:hypothetical protein
MERTAKLRTSEGNKIRIVLENCSGMDRAMRRRTWGDGYWQCMDSGEIAQESRWGKSEGFAARNPVFQSSGLVADGPRAQEKIPGMCGQTMVEYAPSSRPSAPSLGAPTTSRGTTSVLWPVASIQP